MTGLVRFRVNAPDVISETIDGESVIINLATGSYYSLDKIGADVWNLLEADASSQSVVEWLMQRYESNSNNIEEAAMQLIEQLQQENLIVPISAEASEAELNNSEQIETAVVVEKLPFETPTLQKFSDMEDLLLLDPIHEVDEAVGWPNKKTA